MMAQSHKVMRLPRDEEGQPRYLHPNGYVIVRNKRTWSERVGAMRGQATAGPMFWWEVFHHIAKRRTQLDGRPAAFRCVVSERQRARDFEYFQDAREWCDEHPREGWAA